MVVLLTQRVSCYKTPSFLLMAFACVTCCADFGCSNNSNKVTKTKPPPSADSLLAPEDYGKFRQGRAQKELLKDLNWRGNFEFATTFDEKRVAAISYSLFGGIHRDHGTSVLAIFIGDKFEKLVRWPEPEVNFAQNNINIGDFIILRRAFESDAVTISELEKEMKENLARENPKSFNPAVTAAWLLFGHGIQARRAAELPKNAALRDQFNAARLRIGMRQSDVESILKGKPIESGSVQAGTYRIYGSTESFDITDDLHYSNILLVFRDGKVSGIYSGALVPGGYGMNEMREWFVDLPKRRVE